MAENEIDQVIRRMSRTPLSRRGFLYASTMSAAAAFLAACSGGTSSAAPTSGASSAPTAGTPSAGASAGASTAALPSYATEGSLYMYNWADYVAPENIDAFKADYGIAEFTYDTYASNEELMTKLQGGATGLYDIGAPTGEFIKALVDQDFIQELDFSRIPNARYIDPVFQNFYAADGPDARYNAYHLPKDWGTTGIALRRKDVPDEVNTWKQFFEVAPKYSGRIVVVNSPGDVLTAPLKALGYSLNSVDPTELNQARELLRGLAPHVLALDSDTYQDKIRTEEAVLGLTWTGGVVDLRDEEETKDTEYIVPNDGTLYWLDTWTIFKDPPHPEAAYAFLNFIQDPTVGALEVESNRYATANTEAMKLVDPDILADPAVFPPQEVFAKLEGANDVSTDPLRIEIWEEFVSSVGG